MQNSNPNSTNLKKKQRTRFIKVSKVNRKKSKSRKIKNNKVANNHQNSNDI